MALTSSVRLSTSGPTSSPASALVLAAAAIAAPAAPARTIRAPPLGSSGLDNSESLSGCSKLPSMSIFNRERCLLARRQPSITMIAMTISPAIINPSFNPISIDPTYLHATMNTTITKINHTAATIKLVYHTINNQLFCIQIFASFYFGEGAE